MIQSQYQKSSCNAQVSKQPIVQRMNMSQQTDEQLYLDQIITSGQPYQEEWNRICNATQRASLEPLISLALTGKLRSCRFRSVCWSLFLNVLPVNSSEVSVS